jgi:hypothetical protein
MFFLYTSRFGLLGSIVLSIAVTAVLVLVTWR